MVAYCTDGVGICVCVAVCSQPSCNSLCVEPPVNEEAITTFTKQRVMPVLHQVQHYRDALKQFRYETIITVLAVVNVSVGVGVCVYVCIVCVYMCCVCMCVWFLCVHVCDLFALICYKS